VCDDPTTESAMVCGGTTASGADSDEKSRMLQTEEKLTLIRGN